MTEKQPSHKTSIEKFYDWSAIDYDLMTEFEKRFSQERPWFQKIVDQYRIKTALDAGCGTGFHAILLSQLGIRVTGVDVSKEMVERAKQHAREFKAHIYFVQSDFLDLNSKLTDKFDSVFCLGNTLPNILNEDHLQTMFQNFALLLNEKGTLIVQLLNYERILALQQRVQNIKEVNGKIFIRFYDYGRDLLDFNILILERKDNKIMHRLNTVQLRPYLFQELQSAVIKSGFKEIRTFGNMMFDNFNPTTSKDLVVVARKL